jgi:hypothetical protein
MQTKSKDFRQILTDTHAEIIDRDIRELLAEIASPTLLFAAAQVHARVTRALPSDGASAEELELDNLATLWLHGLLVGYRLAGVGQ